MQFKQVKYIWYHTAILIFELKYPVQNKNCICVPNEKRDRIVILFDSYDEMVQPILNGLFVPEI